MTTVIDAIYENGVLRPLNGSGLKENQRYHLILHETPPPSLTEFSDADPEFAVELERRTTVLPDGQSIIRLGGIWETYLPEIPEDYDPVREALDELRREQAAHFEAELDE